MSQGKRTGRARPRSQSPASATDALSPDGSRSNDASLKPPAADGAALHYPDASSRRPPPSGVWRRTFDSLNNRNFLFYWLGLLALMGGMQMQMLARGYLVYEITGSGALLGIVSAGSAVPILALSLFGGAIADRMDRGRVIQAGQALNALLALAVGVTIMTDRIAWYHLLAASVVQGGLWSFLMPARQALIPQLVSKEQLTNAVALSAAAMSVTTLVSPAVAGGIYALLGPDAVYYVICALSVVAFSLTGLIKSGGGPARSDAPMVKDILDGLQHIRRNPLVAALLAMGLAAALLTFPFRLLLPVFVVDIYNRGPDANGLLLAAMGAGSLAGALFIAFVGKGRRGVLLISGGFLSGVALMMVAAVPFYFAAAAIMILMGLGDAGRRSLNQALIMEEVEDRFRGRVMSVFMMSFGLAPLGILPMGFAIDALGPRPAIGILATLTLLITAAILATQKRLRELP